MAPHSQARAQPLLDRAAVPPGARSSGTFTLSYSFGAKVPARVSGRYIYSPTLSTAAFEYRLGPNTVRARLVGGDAWVGFATKTRPQRCWLHLKRGGPGRTTRLVGGLTPVMAILADPHARGLLADGRAGQVVMDLDTKLGLYALLPSLANKVSTQPGSTVPAVATIKDGRIETLVFDAGAVVNAVDPDDLIDAADDQGFSVNELLTAMQGDATVTYDIGAPAAPIEPPPDAQVRDLVTDKSNDPGPCA